MRRKGKGRGRRRGRERERERSSLWEKADDVRMDMFHVRGKIAPSERCALIRLHGSIETELQDKTTYI